MIFAIALLFVFAVCAGHMAYMLLRLHHEAQDDSRYDLD
jgi:hypothetical protein